MIPGLLTLHKADHTSVSADGRDYTVSRKTTPDILAVT